MTRAVERLVHERSVVVVQGEIPVETIVACVLAASDAGARPIVNLAPVVELPAESIQSADPLVMSEVDAAHFTGYVIDSPARGRQAAADIARRARSVVITMGAAGASWATGGESGIVPGLPVAEVVDTTGAGDALIGAMAAMFAEGHELESAVRVGVEVAALAVARVGAQATYPMRHEVRQLAHSSAETPDAARR